VDGRTLLVDAGFEPLGAVGPWGSDLAATEARCAGGTQVVASESGDARETDELRAWNVVNRAAVAVTPPMDMPGPVTALWSLGGAEAIAVVHDLASGKYAAYLVRVVCGG
jgi:1,4-dihydroxy-2-naphthoyl-CoA synthase